MKTACHRNIVAQKPATCWSAIGRLHWLAVVRNEHRALAGDVKALHDLRVALRRFRVWLRISEEMLSGVLSKSLVKTLRQTQKRLGPARDADVALAVLKSLPVKDNQRVRARDKVMARLARMARLRRADAARHLRGRVWATVKRRVEGVLAEIENAESIPPPLVARAGQLALKDVTKRVKRRCRRPNKMRPAELHSLRVAVRKWRYICEFLAPFVSSQIADTGRRVKDWQDWLGDIHDLDIVSQCLDGMPEAERSDLFEMLAKRRRRLIKKRDLNLLADEARVARRRALKNRRRDETT